MQIENDRENSKFKTIVDGLEAVIIYSRGPDGIYDLVHTLVPPELEGRGIASQLVRFAIETAKSEHVQIYDTCPYVHEWFKKHPEERTILYKGGRN